MLLDTGGFFESVLGRMKSRMQELGSRKVMAGDRWYWISKPDIKPGEEFKL